MRFPSAGLLTSLVAAAPMMLAGCGKPKSTTKTPADGGSAQSEATSGKAVTIHYSDIPVTLRQEARVDFTTTGGGAYAQATLDVRSDLTLRGENDTVEVGWKVVSLADMTLDGSLAGGKSEDTQDYVRGQGVGAWVISRSGIIDLRKSDGHPANTKRLSALAAIDTEIAERRAAGEQDVLPPPGAALLKLLPELLELPRLPAEPIQVGASVETQEIHETALTGTEYVIPTETTVRYTLVSMQSGAGIRLAEISFEAEDWGGIDLEEGEVVLKNATEGSMLFDVDRGVPVNLNFTREESLVAGEISYDTTKIVTATFELVDPA
ncbi:MAG: hypothetical protein AAF721_26525 [Myxococcota bacterium]